MGEPLRRQEILTQALATPPTERSAFLDTACGADEALRRDIERLILISLPPGQESAATTPSASHKPAQQSAGKHPTEGRARSARIPPRLKQALKNTYIMQEHIGGGGMGDLYLATHKTLGGKWAIKVLAEDFAQNPKVVERFVNEAKIEANLQHPNIVKVFHIGHSGGFHYLVMNYVDGEDLAARIARSGIIPESEAVSIVVQICKALECAHDHKITHRDLKPSNIRIDTYGTVIVLDFGIARARDVAMSGITSQGERLGTPLYMSPEQTRGATADARSDLYSLGVIMYEMLSGMNPFEADSAHAVYAKQLNYTPPPVGEAYPGVSALLSEIVMRLLDKDPDKRFQTAREVNVSLRPLREITEVNPPVQTFPSATPEARAAAERMNHVVLRVPETVISRELSTEEKRILELTDGRRTVAEILALSELEPERLFSTLDGLKSERAIETLAKAEPEGSVAVLRRFLDRIVAAIPLEYRKYALGALLVILAGVSALVIHSRFTAAPSLLSPVQFDASPFATVSIKDGRGQEIYRADTPFQYALKPGKYSVEFKYGDSIKPRSLAVEAGKPASLRENFWTDKDVERLLKSYLDTSR